MALQYITRAMAANVWYESLMHRCHCQWHLLPSALADFLDVQSNSRHTASFRLKEVGQDIQFVDVYRIIDDVMF